MAVRIPNGVACLISALAVHELVTQVLHAVDIAIARGAEKPRIDYPPVNVYWFSGNAFTSGVETRPVDGARIRVYGPEKRKFSSALIRKVYIVEMVLFRTLALQLV